MSENGPGLILYDGKGKVRASLDVIEDGPGLTLRDGKGKVIWRAP